MVKNTTQSVKADRLLQLGRERFDALIERAGGTYDMDTVCEILGVDSDTVLKMIQESRLISLPKNDGLVFPLWQFKDKRLLPGLEKILRTLQDRDPESQCLFMLTPLLNQESGQSPLKILENSSLADMEPVLRATAQYGMQGAK